MKTRSIMPTIEDQKQFYITRLPDKYEDLKVQPAEGGVYIEITDTAVYGGDITLSRGEVVTVIDWLSKAIYEGPQEPFYITRVPSRSEDFTLTSVAEGIRIEATDTAVYGGEITLSRGEVVRLIEFLSASIYE